MSTKVRYDSSDDVVKNGTCSSKVESSQGVHVELASVDAADADSSSSSSSSPEVDQHLHQEEKKTLRKDAGSNSTAPRDALITQNADVADTGNNGNCQQNLVSETNKELSVDGKTSSHEDRTKMEVGKGSRRFARHSYHRNKLLEIRRVVASCSKYPQQLLPPAIFPLPDDKRWLEDLILPKTSTNRPGTPPSPVEGGKGAPRSLDGEGGGRRGGAGGSRDPRERVKQEEQDGIVLSPQRRSFGTGCHGLQGQGSSSGSRPDSPADRSGGSGGRSAPEPSSLTSVHHRLEAPLHRRIGSGRIMRRDDTEAPPLLDARGVSTRRGLGNGDLDLPDPPRGRDPRDWRNKEPLMTHHHLRYGREDRFDGRRRGFFEEVEQEKAGGSLAHAALEQQQQQLPSQQQRRPQQQQQQRNNNNMDSRSGGRNRQGYGSSHHHGGHNYRRHEEEETPEWFSEGPTSQHEFIELVGFDGPAPDDSKSPDTSKRNSPVHKDSPERPPSLKDGSGGSTASRSPVEPLRPPAANERRHSPPSVARPASTPLDRQSPPQQLQLPQLSVQEPPQEESNGTESIPFNIEDFLENIIGTEGEGMNGGGGGESKLKQFFRSRESPPTVGRSGPPAPAEDGRASRCSDSDLASVQVASMLSELNLDPNYRLHSPSTELDSNRFFTPINPADATVPPQPASNNNNNNNPSIVDLLQQATRQQGHSALPHSLGALLGQHHHQQHAMNPAMANPPSVKDLLMDGKGRSLEELEAGLRKYSRPNVQLPPPPPDSTGGHMHPTPGGSGGHMQPQAGSGHYTDLQEFLSQVRAPSSAEAIPSSPPQHVSTPDNVLSKFLSGGGNDGNHHVNRQPLPHTQTDTEFLSMLLKNEGGSRGSFSPPGPPTLHVPPQPRQLQPQQEFIWKLLQQQQQQAQQQQAQQQAHQHHQQQQQQQMKHRQIMQALQQQQQQQQQQKQQQQHHHHHHQQQQHLDPIKQLVGGLQHQQQRVLSPHPGVGPPPQLHHPGAVPPALRPEVHNLLQRVGSGQITDVQLLAQLQNSGAGQRENINTVLQLLAPPLQTGMRNQLTPSPTHKGGLCLGSGPVSPRVLSPNPVDNNMLAPHPLSQARVSPLMFAGAPRPLPSHQELVARAQCILQKALLKQELEKSKEKHRKRDSERGRSPNPSAVSVTTSAPAAHKEGSPHKSVMAKSQSPLVFTPTSVMRRSAMGGDRDKLAAERNAGGSGLQDSSGGGGTPCVSGYNPLQPPPSVALHHSGNHLLGPKSQQLVMGSGGSGAPNLRNPPPGPPQQSGGGTFQQQHSRHPGPPHTAPQNLNLRPHPNLGNLQAQAAFTQQMIRAGQHQQHRHPSHQQQHPAALHHVYNAINNNHHGALPQGHSQHNMQQQHSFSGGRLSPGCGMSLAQLLGGDVLAQAQAAGLPQLPGGKVLRLEEVERLHHASH